jgi:hypothetical protein
MTDQELIDLLNKQAQEIAESGQFGWGNTMLEAALRLDELIKEKTYYDRKRS